MPRHPQYDANDRLAVLLHEGILGKHGKTGLALIRFAPERVAVVIDRQNANGSLAELTGIPLRNQIPIVENAAEALSYGPSTLAIGIAPLGGRLPEAWYPDLIDALQGGLNILNGLHTRLADDPRLQDCIQPGRWIWDIRQEPAGLVSGSGAARLLPCKRVLFVGTDMSIGKMSAAIAFHRCAITRGIRSKFMATGQTGIMLEGDGIPLDAIRVDFASGAVQQEVAACALHRDVVFIEGQGSLLNPASTATLPLMRGSQPTNIVLCHRAQMHHLRDFRWVRIPPLRDVVAMLESVACAGGALAPVRVGCIVMNTHGLSETEARYEIERIRAETGLPVDDVVRFGAQKLLDSVL
ncbi:MAG: DUF1611 domain-containing protein [Planctomycetota bacterium]|jgi:uncharacterized NAD-dependent epimerase/dehydratase family protein